MESGGVINAASRPLANYHPSIWGDRFLAHIPDSRRSDKEQVIEKLKEEVEKDLKEASKEYMQLLKLVDAIQRLGIGYLFEEDIDQALQELYEKYEDHCRDNRDMYTIALTFRLLRQHGYRVSSKMFDKFKDDEEDGFKFPDPEEAAGVLEFFEATHLRVHGEDILDNGYNFSRNYLESVLPGLANPVAKQVHHALYVYSNRRGYTRLEARQYIPLYEQYASHHRGLLRLAKLDFDVQQSLHKRELSEVCRWWKDLEVSTKLSYARDRIVEIYFWTSGIYFEPKYAFARYILTRLQALTSVLDDTFDAYGTFKELQLFTEAIQRWSFSCLDGLPDYMKIIYKAILEFFEEIEEEMNKQGTSSRLSYGIKAIKDVAQAYFSEIKWREEKHMPKTAEYMQAATASSAYTSLMIISFLGMDENVTKEAFDWVLSQPHSVRGASVICRLSDDIAGHEFERKREHIPSAIECFMEEHGATKQEAVYEFNKQIEHAWKDMNEACLRPTAIPTAPLQRVLNFARGIEVIYSKGDWYTNVGPEMQSFISQLYIDPLP